MKPKIVFRDVFYRPSSEVVMTPAMNRKVNKAMLERGYNIVDEDRNRYKWRLPARVVLILQVNGTVKSFDVKEKVLDLYARLKISKPLADQFKEDCIQERIIVHLESDNVWFEKK